MQGVDLSKPGEKKKLIAAAVLGLGAIMVLWWALIGFGSSARPRTQNSSSTQRPNSATASGSTQGRPVSQDVQELVAFAPIAYEPTSYSPPEAKRNIFAYWEPPQPTPRIETPTPTPEPSPAPVLLASLSPANVYARTGDFTLEVAGDRFTPQMRIFVDGREMPTTYKSPQQMSTTIPAAFIVAPGSRQVMARTSDNSLYTDSLAINVAAPPIPNYTYIGIISPINHVGETALVQDKGNRNVLSVLRGDVLSGRFRVTSISEKELVLTDTSLKIKHTLPMAEGDKSAGPLTRPTPRVDAEDDEP